jgi:CheY-like chemotaxis protein
MIPKLLDGCRRKSQTIWDLRQIQLSDSQKDFTMNENPLNFGQTAKSLARNPLGIIALFIVLIYGVAGLVTTFATSLTVSERLPLIWFLVIFPVVVLIVFAWLVSKHSGKLYSPSDYKNEENYVKMQMTAVASLTAATAKSDAVTTETDIQKIVDAVRQSLPAQHQEVNDWRNHVLWVDDRPENNIYERRAFESVGLRFTLALSTSEALDLLKANKYAAIISDMGRPEGHREGYILLDTIRRQGNQTPFIIYAGSNLPEHKQETFEHGGQGTTNHPQELFQIVMKAIVTHN